MCESLLSLIGRAMDVRRAPVQVGSFPGRQLSFVAEGRHHVARVTFTGRHAYFWVISADRPLTENDPMASAFLGSVTVRD